MPNGCEICGGFGEFQGKDMHGSLCDYSFVCDGCGNKWTFITEGAYMRRKQIEFPRDKHLAFEWLEDFI